MSDEITTAPLAEDAFTGGEKPRIRSCVMVQEQVYHQEPHREATVLADKPFMRWLDSDEQPYQRKGRAGPEWKKLDLGWLDGQGVGLVVVANETGRDAMVNPTKGEAAALAAAVLTIGVQVGDAVEPVADISPGESARFRPRKPGALRVMCESGECKFMASICPA